MDENDEWRAATYDVYDDDYPGDPEPLTCVLDYHGVCSDDSLYDGMCEHHYDMATAGRLVGLDDYHG